MKLFAIFTSASEPAVIIKSECEDVAAVLQWVIDQPSVNERSPFFFAVEHVDGTLALIRADAISQIREFSG